VTIAEICEATGGVYNGDKSLTITGVSTDSRANVEGCLFVPIKGENFDGHDYIETALEKGAITALSEHENDKCIKVADTRQALLDLAAYDRARFKGKAVAITGSAGKTTTKEVIASVLSQKYKTLKTIGNLNNDIGLPLTLLRREPDHEAMVLEMGMNHMGEISVLSRVGKPDICLITNIGDAHIENLGSREGILKAKSEIFEGMKEGGTVILNGDDPLLSGLPPVPHAGKTIYCRIKDENKPAAEGEFRMTISNRELPPGYWITADLISRNGLRGTTCTLEWKTDDSNIPGAAGIIIPLPGDHMIMNAMMAFAVGLEMGVHPMDISNGIRNFQPANNRMAITEANGMTIINDVYNASPSSMKAAIDTILNEPGRKVCILGDMFELGGHAEPLHKEVGEHAAKRKIDLLITIGPLSRHTHEAFTGEAKHFETKESFIKEWQNHLKTGDTVLIKASRGMALESVVEELER